MQSPIAKPSRHGHTFWLATLIASSALAGPVAAQSASIGADVVSRYVWRGIDFGESVSLQPALTVGIAGLEFGAWGSYSISKSAADANENDLWASFTYEFSSGASVSVAVTDYYFPNAVGDERVVLGFLDPKAHTQEFSAALSGPESLPVSLFVGILTDDDKSLYAEVGFTLWTVDGVELGAHAGMVGGESGFYGTSGAGLVNVGITASTALEITDSFAPPVTVSYIVNPAEEYDRAYLVFALSLTP